MSRNEHKALVPRLRFPEFRDAGPWEVKRLGEIYDFMPTNSLSRAKLTYSGGQVKNIHYGDIHTKLPILLDITREVVPFVNTSVDVDSFCPEAFCKEGDIIFADASEDVDDIGKSIELVNLNAERLVSGLHTILARQKSSNLVVGFGGYLFSSSVIRDQIKRESQGSKVLGISPRRLSKIRIYYPHHKKEQRKIADCLSSLDELIAAQAQKIAALKVHKKGLMQQLFPRAGETVPRLRFPEFRNAGPWETVPLARLSELIREKVGNKEVILMSVTSGVGLISQVEKFGREIAGTQHRSYFVLRKNDFAYNKSATKAYPQGFIALYEGNELAAVPNSIFVCFRVDQNKVIPKFLDYQFMNNLHGNWLQRFITIGARAHGSLNIENRDLFALPIPIPGGESSLPEQRKIADFLSSLDELIALEAQKLAALKAHKKGLLQQLFPQEVTK